MDSTHPDPSTILNDHDHVLHVQARYDDDEEEDGPSADPQLEGGMPLPIRLAAEFPPDLTAIPLEDIDPYYQNKKVWEKRFKKLNTPNPTTKKTTSEM